MCIVFTDEQHAPPTKVLSSGLTVKEIWQRIVYEQWIVGIDVENTGERYQTFYYRETKD